MADLHNFTLSPADRARSLVRLASPTSLRPLLRDFRTRDSSIALLGASVGQDGGCIGQPGKRCHDYSGRVRTHLPWPTPRGSNRRFAGFLVRFFNLVNGSWPSGAHRLTNGAADGTPPQSILDCLFSHLPRRLSLVILEFGSMARYISLPAVEALVRVLLSLRPQPSLVFLTVRELCRADKVAFGAKQRPFAANESTVWSRAEARFDALCERYDLSCLSYHRAISRGFYAHAPGFGYEQIAGDCLHPLSGTHGTEMMTDVLVHWLHAAIQAVDADTSALSAPKPLPTPYLDAAAVARAQGEARTARCYALLEGGTGRKSLTYQRLNTVPWQTAFCADGVGLTLPLHSAYGCSAEPQRLRCAALQRSSAPSAQLPRGWLYCFNAFKPDGTLGKKSPGVLGLVAGATIDLPVDSRLGDDAANGPIGSGPTPAAAAPVGTNPPASRVDGRTPRTARSGDGVSLAAPAGTGAGTGAGRHVSLLTVKLTYLTSYEAMGRIKLRCLGGCRCATHILDAHRVTHSERNASVYADHEFALRGASAGCVLRARILNETSSGGHKFKMRFLALTADGTMPGAGAVEDGRGRHSRHTSHGAKGRSPSNSRPKANAFQDEVLP